jgi:hypothetical protein
MITPQFPIIHEKMDPSGVRALALAAGRNKVGHCFRYFSTLFLLLGVPLFKTPEGVVLGFSNFPWAPN